MNHNYLNELWRDIPGYVGIYQVSNHGRIKSLSRKTKNQYSKTEHFLKPGLNKKTGYMQVSLSLDGKHKSYLVHRLVAQVFIPNPNNFPVVNHKNYDKTDNRVLNLEWCTQKYNLDYSNSIDAMQNNHYSIPVLQFDRNGVFLKEWSSATEAENKLGLPKNARINIRSLCNGDIKRHSAYGFIWRNKSFV